MALALALLTTANATLAQAPAVPPGRVLQDLERSLPIRPTPSGESVQIESSDSGTSLTANDQRLDVGAYRITGNSVFDQRTLQHVVAGRTGQMSLAELNAVADALTAYYRTHGYPLARAYLPRQQIEKGVVTIAVLEGRYDRIDTHNSSRISDQRVARTLHSALCRGEETCKDSLISRDALERGLLLLNDTPGAQAAARLSPGSAVGSSTLAVDANAEPLAGGALQFDNAGSYYTGVARAIGTLWINSPARLGDQLTVQGVASDIHGNLYYGALGYDVPLGYSGLRLGGRGAYMRYDLGDRYRSLNAHGRVGSTDASLSFPFIRTRAANLAASVAYGERRFHDFADAIDTQTERHIRGRSELALSGDFRDELLGAPALNTASAIYTMGKVRLDATLAAVDALSARTAGSYDKWGLSYSRLQQIAGRTSFYVRVAAQGTAANLDSYEKFALGGPDSVRAYPSGDTLADQAVLYTAELRQGFGVAWTPALEGVLFYDRARGDLNSSPWSSAPNRVTLSGVGVGLNCALTNRMTLRSMIALRGDRPATAAPDRSYQYGLSLNTAF